MTSRVSRNVLTCKLLKCGQALARGLWNNGILSPYLLILTGGSKTVRPVSRGATADARKFREARTEHHNCLPHAPNLNKQAPQAKIYGAVRSSVMDLDEGASGTPDPALMMRSLMMSMSGSDLFAYLLARKDTAPKRPFLLLQLGERWSLFDEPLTSASVWCRPWELCKDSSVYLQQPSPCRSECSPT